MKTKSRTLRARLTWTAVLALALSLGAIATASAKDRNNDRIPDRWERQHGLSLKVNQAKRDQDRDDLNNRGEYRAGTDPREADSDNDGIQDGDEGAGTISAWDPETGALTINLFGGDTVTGTVTAATEIVCGRAEEAEDSAKRPAPAPAADGEPTSDEPTGEKPGGPRGGPRHGGGGHCEQGVPCTAEDLAVDAVVQEARLSATAEGLVFDRIQLR